MNRLNLDILLDSLKDWGIEKYTINSDGSIDVLHSLNWQNKGLTELPDLKIRAIHGSFNCSYNELESLKGSPKIVYYNFFCNNNQLTTLKESPEIVKGFFNCAKNQLITLEGSPREILGSFDCQYNKLKKLDYSSKIGGKISYYGNLFNKND